jgi:hypothetical protein
MPSTLSASCLGLTLLMPPLAAQVLAAQVELTPAEIETAVQRLAGARSLWPGFEPLSVPLAIHCGDGTWLFRHPHPPDGFARAEGFAAGGDERGETDETGERGERGETGEPVPLMWPGRHPAVTANTSADIGGLSTATLIVDARRPRSAEELAAVAIHEAFHVFQRARHPGWSGNEADLFTYPAGDARLLALRRLEFTALGRALEEAGDAAGSAAWARTALDLRRERFAGMDAAFATYERLTELNEGLAAYVEHLAAGAGPLALPAEEFPPAAIRQRTYMTGPALALLLDRHRPGWQQDLEADDSQPLDVLLASALGESVQPAEITLDEIAAADAAASADVAALAAERAARRAAFESRPGWRVVIEAAPGEPLQLRGFDPLNVVLVDDGVLHARFLSLGHEGGELEAIDEADADIDALTEAAGEHPLYAGVRRVTIAGLAEPEVLAQDGAVTARAPGLTVSFRGARAESSGHTVTIHCAPR